MKGGQEKKLLRTLGYLVIVHACCTDSTKKFEITSIYFKTNITFIFNTLLIMYRTVVTLLNF